MKVSFEKTYYNYANPLNKNKNFGKISQRHYAETKLLGDLGLSVGVGVATGIVAAGILTKKKAPNVFINSLSLGAVFSYITYIGTLLATPFRLK